MLAILKNYNEFECGIIKKNKYIKLQKNTCIYFLTIDNECQEICLLI